MKRLTNLFLMLLKKKDIRGYLKNDEVRIEIELPLETRIQILRDLTPEQIESLRKKINEGLISFHVYSPDSQRNPSAADFFQAHLVGSKIYVINYEGIFEVKPEEIFTPEEVSKANQLAWSAAENFLKQRSLLGGKDYEIFRQLVKNAFPQGIDLQPQPTNLDTLYWLWQRQVLVTLPQPLVELKIPLLEEVLRSQLLKIRQAAKEKKLQDQQSK